MLLLLLLLKLLLAVELLELVLLQLVVLDDLSCLLNRGIDGIKLSMRLGTLVDWMGTSSGNSTFGLSSGSYGRLAMGQGSDWLLLLLLLLLLVVVSGQRVCHADKRWR